MRIVVGVLAAGLAGCVSVETTRIEDGGVAALMRAAPRECPAGRIAANAHTGAATEASGITMTEIARTPLADGSGDLRTRRVVFAPGGHLPWHEHSGRQGMAIVMAGELVETRNMCLDQLTYRAGDVARETADLAHSWRNESGEEAVILAIDVVRD